MSLKLETLFLRRFIIFIVDVYLEVLETLRFLRNKGVRIIILTFQVSANTVLGSGCVAVIN